MSSKVICWWSGGVTSAVSCKVEPLFGTNGMCGTNDLIERKESENQINFTE